MKRRKIFAALLSIFINIFLVVLKYILFKISGSLAIKADAFHSGTDILVSSLVFSGIIISCRETEGAKKSRFIIENTISIIVALFIFFIAFEVFRDVFFKPQPIIGKIPIAIAGTLLAVTITYFTSAFKIHVGKETGSPSLVADGYHTRSDMFSSIVVLAALFGHMIGIKFDKIAAIFIAVLIISTGVEILANAIRAFFLHYYSITSGGIVAIDQEIKKRLFRLRFVYFLRKHKKRILQIALLVFLIFYFVKSFYLIRAREIGVVQRFGKVVSTRLEPGIYFHPLWIFEKLHKLKIYEPQRIEIGFRTREKPTEEPPAYLWEFKHQKGRYRLKTEESHRVIGDLNIVTIWTVIHYRIKDPYLYLFNLEKREDLIRSEAEALESSLLAQESIDDILTVGKEWFQDTFKLLLQKELDSLRSGIEICRVSLFNLHPPVEVVPGFRFVSSAREDKDRYINEAESEFNRILPRARAEAAEKMKEALGYKTEQINRAYGDATRFNSILYAYQRGLRELSRYRLYIETMEKALPDAEKYILDPDLSKTVLDLRSLKDTTSIP